ncbi:MAG: hypothetical protein ABIF10_02960 [Candidatus Woesearchaeota archaeon]
MKPFMDKCHRCGSKVIISKCVKEGILLNCMKCQKCSEEYFTSSELIKFDILTGRKELVRKFGTLGDSTIIRIPNRVLKDLNIRPEDYGVFEKRPEGILIRHVRAKEIES